MTSHSTAASVCNNVFTSHFWHKFYSFLFGQSIPVFSKIRQWNCYVYFGLLKSLTHKARWWTLTLSFYRCRNWNVEQLRDLYKVTQKGEYKVRTDSIRAFSVTFHAPCHCTRAELTNGHIGELKAVFWNLCSRRVGYTDLHFDPSGSLFFNPLSHTTHCLSKLMHSSQGLLRDV